VVRVAIAPTFWTDMLERIRDSGSGGREDIADAARQTTGLRRWEGLEQLSAF
jgi:hypothetical protein